MFIDEHDDTYQRKIENNESNGMDSEEAREEATEDMLPRYRKSMIQYYKDLALKMNALKRSGIHKEITRSIDWYICNKGYDFEKALDLTLRKKRMIFDELIEDGIDEEEEDSEEEEDMEEDEEEEYED